MGYAPPLRGYAPSILYPIDALRRLRLDGSVRAPLHQIMATPLPFSDGPIILKVTVESLADNGRLYFLDKNYFLEESDYLNDKLPDRIRS